jgi:hypothetical protein
MVKPPSKKRFRPGKLEARLLNLGQHPALGRVAALVYVWLAYGGEEGRWPGTTALACLVGTTRSTVLRARQMLCACGLLHIDGEGADQRYSLGSLSPVPAPVQKAWKRVATARAACDGVKVAAFSQHAPLA